MNENESDKEIKYSLQDRMLVYTAKSASKLSAAEYKVINTYADRLFIRTSKIMYNGYTQLYYHVGNNKAFISLKDSIDSAEVKGIIIDLLEKITEVKRNGFLSCEAIDLSYEHIYFDPVRKSVLLVYLPFKDRIYNNYQEFDKSLRNLISKFISEISEINNPEAASLSAEISEKSNSIEEILKKLKTEVKDEVKTGLVLIDNMGKEIKQIFEGGLLLGKKKEKSDLIIDSKKVSRKHCRIEKTGKGFMLTDLNSANGTFINNSRLVSAISYELKNKDIIRLADVEFEVRIESV